MDIIFLVIALICGVGIGLLVNYLIAKSKGDVMLKESKRGCRKPQESQTTRSKREIHQSESRL